MYQHVVLVMLFAVAAVCCCSASLRLLFVYTRLTRIDWLVVALHTLFWYKIRFLSRWQSVNSKNWCITNVLSLKSCHTQHFIQLFVCPIHENLTLLYLQEMHSKLRVSNPSFSFFLQIDAPEAKFISHHLDILCSDTDVPDKARPCANSEPTTGHYSGGTERMHTKTTIKVMPATRCTLWEHSTSSPRIAVIVHQTKCVQPYLSLVIP